jgi:hypothetical protein
MRLGDRMNHGAVDKIPMRFKKMDLRRALGCQPTARLVAAIVIIARYGRRVF